MANYRDNMNFQFWGSFVNTMLLAADNTALTSETCRDVFSACAGCLDAPGELPAGSTLSTGYCDKPRTVAREVQQ